MRKDAGRSESLTVDVLEDVGAEEAHGDHGGGQSIIGEQLAIDARKEGPFLGARQLVAARLVSIPFGSAGEKAKRSLPEEKAHFEVMGTHVLLNRYSVSASQTVRVCVCLCDDETRLGFRRLTT